MASGSSALIVDDHAIFRSGLSALLRGECGVGTVVEADGLDAAIDVLGAMPGLRLATFDLSMPGMSSASTLRGVRESFPNVRMVVLTGSGARRDILDALEAGAHGFIPKAMPLDAIARALAYVMDGNVYVPPSLANLEVADTRRKAVATPLSKLTPRQRDILARVGVGRRSNKEIARDLDLTENTVKVHLTAIFRVLNIHDRRQIPGALASLEAPCSVSPDVQRPLGPPILDLSAEPAGGVSA